MHLPHPFLILPVAAVCWLAGGLWNGAPTASQAGPEVNNPFAIRQSAYGRMAARLMKDSLHSYWHAGCTDPTHNHTPAVLPAGRFASRQAVAVPPPAAPEPKSWLDRCTKSLSSLEHMRTVRNSPFAPGNAHRRYLAASADWRVHLAWQLDPCDAALYEIDHFGMTARAPSPEAAGKVSVLLARHTIVQALSPQAGPADALTGAGAAINLLNEQLLPGHVTQANVHEVQHDWRVLNLCLSRHRDLRQQAAEEDWWNDIPEVRRQEIESYARMLEKLSGTIRLQLASNGLLSP